MGDREAKIVVAGIAGFFSVPVGILIWRAIEALL